MFQNITLDHLLSKLMAIEFQKYEKLRFICFLMVRHMIRHIGVLDVVTTIFQALIFDLNFIIKKIWEHIHFYNLI